MLRIEHECEIEMKQDEVIYVPIDTSFRRIVNTIRYLIMASVYNPAARKFLRSRVSIIVEMRQHLRNYEYIIHPFSAFRHFWDFLMVGVMIVLLLAVPYYSIFESRYKRYLYWTILKNILLLICVLDIVFNFMTGYFDKTHHHVVMIPSKIMLRYLLEGTFLFDLAGSFPTDILFACFDEDQRLTYELISLLCLFRTISLNIYIRKLAEAYDIPSTSFGLLTIIFWFIIILHWQACVNWLTPLVSTPWPQRPVNTSWIHKFDLWEQPTDRQYLICLLRSIAIFISAGLRGTVPQTTDDIVLVIVLQLIGAIVICLLISRVMVYYYTIRSSQIRFQDIVAEVRRYMQRRQLSRLQQLRIMTYYEYRYQLRYFRESVILITLSMQMRQEIRMHTCRKLVENVTFFDNLPLTLLTRIVTLLKSEIFLTNDVIVRVNQPGDCMYFIASGTVAIYTGTGKEVCHLEDGAHFGEIALVMPAERRVASVVAIETCELYRLTRADFARTIHPYPMLWDRVKKIAIERHEKTSILDMS